MYPFMSSGVAILTCPLVATHQNRMSRHHGKNRLNRGKRAWTRSLNLNRIDNA